MRCRSRPAPGWYDVDVTGTVIEAAGVVIPARDEAELLPSCLAAVHRAAQHPALADRRVHVVVVCDQCTDATAELAATGGAGTVFVDAGNVGVARAAGLAEILRREDGCPPSRLWLATTDADSQVPPHWLATQVQHAEEGWDAVVGTVSVTDWSAYPPGFAERFTRGYRAAGRGDHPHVHGANLGLSAAAYLDAGGVPPLALAEDHALVNALRRRSRRLLTTTELPVVTSARPTPRATGGFGDRLAAARARDPLEVA